MALTDRLQSVSAGTIARARKLGLPVDDIQRLYDDKLEPQLIKRLSRYVIPFVRRTGVKVVALERGRVVCRMPLKGNVNHIGTMYAGALFTLAEFPGGPLMLATFGMRRYVPIITELDLEFVKATKTDAWGELVLPGDEAERIETETLAHGKAEFTLDGALKDDNGEVVARSRALYQMRPRRR